MKIRIERKVRRVGGVRVRRLREGFIWRRTAREELVLVLCG